MLVDVVTEFAAEVVRPAAAEANETCLAPGDVLEAGLRDRAADPRACRRSSGASPRSGPR